MGLTITARTQERFLFASWKLCAVFLLCQIIYRHAHSRRIYHQLIYGPVFLFRFQKRSGCCHRAVGLLLLSTLSNIKLPLLYKKKNRKRKNIWLLLVRLLNSNKSLCLLFFNWQKQKSWARDQSSSSTWMSLSWKYGPWNALLYSVKIKDGYKQSLISCNCCFCVLQRQLTRGLMYIIAYVWCYCCCTRAIDQEPVAQTRRKRSNDSLNLCFRRLIVLSSLFWTAVGLSAFFCLIYSNIVLELAGFYLEHSVQHLTAIRGHSTWNFVYQMGRLVTDKRGGIF